MNKQAPSIGQLVTIAGFALACFGLLLFVWSAFGGPTPLAATGYKLKMPMTQIDRLAEQSQVKISGVEVGRVSGIELGKDDQKDLAIVTLEIEPEYAPVPKDTRAILRAKSLIGRTMTAAEVAEAVYWLCLPEARLIRGQTITVDAGYAVMG